MRIDFVKSGGFAAPLRTVRGSIDLSDKNPEVTADAGYRRSLSRDEIDQLRAAADAPALTQAAATLSGRTRAAADLDHYHVTITNDDGATHEVDFNTSGGSKQLDGVAPAVAGLLGWMRDESKKILMHRATGA